MILKTPVVSAIAVLSLALGVSVNVSNFSLLNAWLLRPLPYPDAERLVVVFENNRNDPDDTDPASVANFFDWREQSGSFDAWIAADLDVANLTDVHPPQQLDLYYVTPNFFELLGSEAMIGRTFSPDEGAADDNPVAVMGETVWRTHYGSDAGIVGRTIILDGTAHTVIGVIPETFDFIQGSVSVWIASDFEQRRDERGPRELTVTGRLRPGVSIDQAQQDLATIAGRLEEAHPDSNADWGVNLQTVREVFPGPTDTALVQILMLVVFLALLIACANVASLLLAKADARQKEMAIRTALGARKSRIVRQLLIESVVMALAAGLLGLMLSVWGVRGIARAMPDVLPGFFNPRIDGAVIVFAVLLSAFAGLTFGITPALEAVRHDVRSSLIDGTRGGTSSRKRRRLRNLFVMAEFAMALAILIGASVLTDMFDQSLQIDAGYDSSNVLTMELTIPEHRYPDYDAMVRYVDDIGLRLEQISGVESWAIANQLPRTFGMPISTFTIDGQPVEPGQEPRTSWLSVTPGYLETLRMPLRSGRVLADDDRADAPRVVMINERFAERFLDEDEPLGRRITIQGTSREIVGVVNDSALSRLAGLLSIEPVVFFPLAQRPVRINRVMLRTAADPFAAVGPAQDAVWAVDDEQPIAAVQTLDQFIESMLAGPDILGGMLYFVGLLTLALAAMGIYGVMAYAVAQQRHEIGIRMALGALPRQVLGRFARQGLTLAGFGLLVGMPLAIFVARLIVNIPASLADGIALEWTLSPMPMVLVSAILVGVGLIASFLPARSATKVDAVVAFREE